MPEGDSLWKAARRLAPLTGCVLVASDFRVPSLATRDLAGRRVLETLARGKHLLTRVEGGATVHSHLKMEGRWALQGAGARFPCPDHTVRVVLRTDEHQAVGSQVLVDLIATEHEDKLVGHLGPDLLGPDWDLAEALRRLRSRPEVELAEALLEQRNLAGIGNVYKNELCFVAGEHPRTPVGDVRDLERLVQRARAMLEANKTRRERCTTGDPRPGRRLWVYGRRGDCLRCGARVRRTHQGPQGQERITWWCPSCQPAPTPPVPSSA